MANVRSQCGGSLRGLVLGGGIALGWFAPVVTAGEAPDVAVRITATVGGDVAESWVPLGEATYDPSSTSVSWQAASAVSLRTASGVELAEVASAQLNVRVFPPRIEFVATVDAGGSNVKVEADIFNFELPTNSALDPNARARASFQLIDQDGNGASVKGVGAPGTGMYQPKFNRNGANAPRFANLVALVTAGPGGTATGSQRDPAFGYRRVGAGVANVEALVAFELSAGDRVNVSTLFEFDVLPELTGDMNCDGGVGVNDISWFITALAGDIDAFQRYNFGCPLINADCNDDGTISSADIGSFIDLLF